MPEIVDIEKTWDYDDPGDRTVSFTFELDETKRQWRAKTRSFVRGTVVTNYFFPQTKADLEKLYLERLRA